MPVDRPEEVVINIYLPFRNTQDVQNFINYAADVWARYPRQTSAMHPRLPTGPQELAKAGHLDLGPSRIDREILSAWRYMERIRVARREGRPLPVQASNSRTCVVCEQSWPSFAHYLTSPNPPKHIRCRGCFKRVPVVSFQSSPPCSFKKWSLYQVLPTFSITYNPGCYC